MRLRPVFEEDISSLIDRLDWSAFRDNRILITGATGVVGAYLVWLFQEALSRGCTNADTTAVSRSGVYRLKLPGREEPVTLATDVSEGFPKSLHDQFDIVIHAAGYGQPAKFLSNPIAAIQVNTSGTINALRAVRRGGVLAFASSSEIYSGLSTPLAVENQVGATTPTHPRAAYIEAKRCGEAIVNAATSDGCIRGLNFRLALAYGPGAASDDGRVLYQLIQRGLVEKRILLRDAGSAMRTYCYVSDAVEMIVKLIASGHSGTFNVGGVSRTSILSLARLVGSITEAEVEIPQELGGAMIGAPDDVRLDLTKTLGVTGKENFVALHDGVQRTVSWMRAQLD